MIHPLCRTADIPETGTKILPVFGREVHVWRDSAGRFRAAANACLHLGGPLECKNGRLVCPWHGASFDLDTGARIGGPAPAGSRLMFLPTRTDGETLVYVWGEPS